MIRDDKNHLLRWFVSYMTIAILYQIHILNQLIPSNRNIGYASRRVTQIIIYTSVFYLNKLKHVSLIFEIISM